MVTDSKKDIEEYNELSKEYADYDYFYTSTELGRKVFPRIAAVPTVVVLTAYGEGERYYVPAFTQEDFESFLIQSEKQLVVTELSQNVLNNIFRGPTAKNTGIIVFRNVFSISADEIDRNFKAAARRLRSEKYQFVVTDISDDGFPKQLANYLYVTEADLPSLYVVQLVNGDIKRYAYKGNMTEEGLVEFVRNFEAGSAKQNYKSEPTPKENSGPVYKLVRDTFEREVTQTEQDVLVNFCVPWNATCTRLEKEYEALAKKLISNKHLKLATIDMTKNDLDGQKVEIFPTLKLFPKGNKNPGVVYTGALNEKEIVEFLKSKCSSPVEVAADK